MNEIKKGKTKLNKQQRVIIAIAIPILLLILAMPIAEKVAYEGRYAHGHPFGFDETWWVWLIYVAIVGVIEYKLFEQKEKE